MAKMHTFTEAFTTTALNLANWTEFTNAGGTTTYTNTGASMNYPDPTSTSNDAEINSINTYDLVNSYALIQVTNAPRGLNSDANFRLRIDSLNYVQWQQEGTGLLGTYVIAGAQTIKANITYDPVLHRWLRIRESGGTTFWDTSSDGVTWVNRASNANPITLTALQVNLSAVSFGSDVALTPFTFNRLNMPIKGASFNNRGLRPHQFSPGLAR